MTSRLYIFIAAFIHWSPMITCNDLLPYVHPSYNAMRQGVHRGVHVPPPPQKKYDPEDHQKADGQQAGSTHPTGMHSSLLPDFTYLLYLLWRLAF